MVENFDPNTIEDEGLRQVFITLMNTWWKGIVNLFVERLLATEL